MSMETYDRKPIRLSNPTPLGDAYFSDFNRESIHSNLISSVMAKTGVTIAKQNDSDLQSLMRVVYTDLVRDPNTDVRSQVSAMNAEVVKRAIKTISTGVLQQAVYLRDIGSNPVPMAAPTSTSTYGNKIPTNFKFGIF
jgi:Family of unknown function (DUF5761)